MISHLNSYLLCNSVLHTLALQSCVTLSVKKLWSCFTLCEEITLTLRKNYQRHFFPSPSNKFSQCSLIPLFFNWKSPSSPNHLPLSSLNCGFCLFLCQFSLTSEIFNCLYSKVHYTFTIPCPLSFFALLLFSLMFCFLFWFWVLITTPIANRDMRLFLAPICYITNVSLSLSLIFI